MEADGNSKSQESILSDYVNISKITIHDDDEEEEREHVIIEGKKYFFNLIEKHDYQSEDEEYNEEYSLVEITSGDNEIELEISEYVLFRDIGIQTSFSESENIQQDHKGTQTSFSGSEDLEYDDEIIEEYQLACAENNTVSDTFLDYYGSDVQSCQNYAEMKPSSLENEDVMVEEKEYFVDLTVKRNYRNDEGKTHNDNISEERIQSSISGSSEEDFDNEDQISIGVSEDDNSENYSDEQKSHDGKISEDSTYSSISGSSDEEQDNEDPITISGSEDENLENNVEIFVKNQLTLVENNILSNELNNESGKKVQSNQKSPEIISPVADMEQVMVKEKEYFIDLEVKSSFNNYTENTLDKKINEHSIQSSISRSSEEDQISIDGSEDENSENNAEIFKKSQHTHCKKNVVADESNDQSDINIHVNQYSPETKLSLVEMEQEIAEEKDYFTDLTVKCSKNSDEQKTHDDKISEGSTYSSISGSSDEEQDNKDPISGTEDESLGNNIEIFEKDQHTHADNNILSNKFNNQSDKKVQTNQNSPEMIPPLREMEQVMVKEKEYFTDLAIKRSYNNSKENTLDNKIIKHSIQISIIKYTEEQLDTEDKISISVSEGENSENNTEIFEKNQLTHAKNNVVVDEVSDQADNNVQANQNSTENNFQQTPDDKISEDSSQSSINISSDEELVNEDQISISGSEDENSENNVDIFRKNQLTHVENNAVSDVISQSDNNVQSNRNSLKQDITFKRIDTNDEEEVYNDKITHEIIHCGKSGSSEKNNYFEEDNFSNDISVTGLQKDHVFPKTSFQGESTQDYASYSSRTYNMSCYKNDCRDEAGECFYKVDLYHTDDQKLADDKHETKLHKRDEFHYVPKSNGTYDCILQSVKKYKSDAESVHGSESDESNPKSIEPDYIATKSEWTLFCRSKKNKQLHQILTLTKFSDLETYIEPATKLSIGGKYFITRKGIDPKTCQNIGGKWIFLVNHGYYWHDVAKYVMCELFHDREMSYNEEITGVSIVCKWTNYKVRIYTRNESYAEANLFIGRHFSQNSYILEDNGEYYENKNKYNSEPIYIC